MKVFVTAIAAALALTATAGHAEISAADQVKQMGAGMNVIGGYDGYWTGGQSYFRDDTLQMIKAAGFSTVRVPLFTFQFLDKDGHLSPAYFKKLDHIVDLAQKAGLNIILDEHDFDDCEKDTDACAVLLSNVWYELSAHYKDAPDSVMFELLNEPHGKIDAKTWNAWLSDLTGIVRETNPTRNIVIGPVGWNSIDQLDNLTLPEGDTHIITTFHYYSPMLFTHQGASWAGAENQAARNVRWTGTKEQMATLNSDFDKAQAWGKAHNRPVFLGEYGTYAAFNPNMADRVAWTKAISKAADARGFARAYWYFEDGNGFAAFDQAKTQWIEPIKDALVKP